MGTDETKGPRMNTAIFNESIPAANRVEIDNLSHLVEMLHGDHQPAAETFIRSTDPKVVPTILREVRSARHRYGEDFVNYLSREDARDAIAIPQTHLIDAVEEARRIIATEIQAPEQPRRRVMRGREFGDSIDSDRYLRRVAECWDRSERPVSRSQTIRIAVNLATPCTVKPHQMIWRGATAVALADELQSKGFNCEIVAFRANHGFFEKDRSIGYGGCFIKRANEPVDIASLATICCCAGFYRLSFVPAIITQTERRVAVGWGVATDVPRERVNADVIIDSSVRTKQDAMQQIEAMLKNLGV